MLKIGPLSSSLSFIFPLGWLCVRKQVLLVGSSEQSPHVTALCTLASILEGELNATVHLSLWAQSSQTEAGAQKGLADLGPLPWLYGQWEAVSKAQGRVLIVWSPEAKEIYKKWKEERTNMDKRERNPELVLWTYLVCIESVIQNYSDRILRHPSHDHMTSYDYGITSSRLICKELKKD